MGIHGLQRWRFGVTKWYSGSVVSHDDALRAVEDASLPHRRCARTALEDAPPASGDFDEISGRCAPWAEDAPPLLRTAENFSGKPDILSGSNRFLYLSKSKRQPIGGLLVTKHNANRYWEFCQGKCFIIFLTQRPHFEMVEELILPP
jgi:hypothetical protein